MSDTTQGQDYPPPVFGPDGRMMGNLTSAQGQPPQQPGAPSLAPQSPLAAMGPPPAPTAGPPPQGHLNSPPPVPQPQLQGNKEPPPDAKEYQKDAMAWASAFAVLGAISGRFTRAPGGAALAAFGAAVKGWQTGNLQAYETASKEWEEKNKQALENNKTELEQYKLSLENRQLNIDEQMQQIQLTAANYHNKIMYDLAQSKNFTAVAQAYEKGVKFTAEGGEAGAKLAGKRRLEEAQQALLGERLSSGQIDPDGLDPQTGQPYTEAQKLNFKHTQERYESGFYGTPGGAKGGGGVSGIRMSQRNEIISNLTQSLGRRPTEPEISAEVARQAGEISAARVTASAEPRADAATLTGLVKQKSSIESFERTAIANGEKLKQLADKVDRTGRPAIEGWLRAGRQATGDVAVAEFNTQMNVYRAEVAKIITNPNLSGVLSDSARREVDGFMSGGASAKQIRAVVDLLTQDFGRRMQSIDDEIATVRSHLKGGKGEASAPSGGGGAEDPLGIR